MRRFLNKVVGDFRSTKAARSTRRAPRHASLQVEGLEDRLVLTSATLTGTTLTVNVSPGGPIPFALKSAGILQPAIRQITFQADAHSPGKLQLLDDGALVPVFDNGVLVPEVAIASIKNAKVNLAFADAVTVNDSNGLPFASGTKISMSGSGFLGGIPFPLPGLGSFNSLTLTGSRTISGGETYVAGNGAQAASLSLGGSTYAFSGSVGPVTDSVKTTGSLVVEAFGKTVSLSGSDGSTQRLSGLSNGGAGDSLSYSNKSTVELDQLAAGSVTLSATAGAAGERSFTLVMHAGLDAASIQATPGSVPTTVTAATAGATVELDSNSAPVTINGNATTVVNVGVLHNETTSGIKANVLINGAKSIVVDNAHNATTQEHVTVTESTVSGTGLFGNNAAVLHYSGLAVGPQNGLTIDTGSLHNTYAVKGSQTGARFTPDKIVIVDRAVAPSAFHPIATNGGLDVQVTVDSGSGLNLSLFDDSDIVNGTLSISAVGRAFFNPSAPSFGQGTETVTFVRLLPLGVSGPVPPIFPIIGLTSTVSYSGFSSISLS
jgi:hypothetical protein